MRGVLKFILIIFFTVYLNANYSNKLSKVFHHIGRNEDKIVLYFDNNPMINESITKSGKQKIVTFTFANSIISDTAETFKMIVDVNRSKYKYYQVNIAINSSSKEIKLKITFDPKFVTKIDVFSFNSIKLFKGIGINIAHKNIYQEKGQNYNFNELNKRTTVILDPGHGGSDAGAIGFNNVTEKDIVLTIAKKLKKSLEKKYNVVMTRESDKTIPLDLRTTLANKLQDDSIFLSLHSNFSVNPKASGIETFFSDSTLLTKFNFEKNKTTTSIAPIGINDYKNFLLASTIHKNILNAAKNYKVIDRKIKKSVSQVLYGTQMPSLLVELGFVTNKKDCNLLCSDDFQNIIVKGAVEGIDEYFSLIS